MLSFRHHFSCELTKGLFHLEPVSRTNVEIQNIAIRSLEFFDLCMRDLFLVDILFVAKDHNRRRLGVGVCMNLVDPLVNILEAARTTLITDNNESLSTSPSQARLAPYKLRALT